MIGEERDALVAYRMEKAHAALEEVYVQVNNKLWNVTANRLYYACFYAVSALLLQNEVTSKTHAGTLQMFGLHFMKTNKMESWMGAYYAKLFTYRQRGDYEDFFDLTEEQAIELMEPASQFISTVERLIKEGRNAK